MALTITDPLGVGGVSIGSHMLTIRNLSFDSSYPTGGEPLTFAQLGFARVPDVVLALPRSGRIFEYNASTQALLAYEDGATVSGPLDEVPNATNLAALTNVVVISIGKYGL